MNNVVAITIYMIAVLTSAWVFFTFYKGYRDEDGNGV